MSRKHPIVAITGSSGAGTSTVTETFEQIFRRESITSTVVHGDSFHRYDRVEMKRFFEEATKAGATPPSHFGPEANDFESLEKLFEQYGKDGTGRIRNYVHDEEEAIEFGCDPEPLPRGRIWKEERISCTTRACTVPFVPIRWISPSTWICAWALFPSSTSSGLKRSTGTGPSADTPPKPSRTRSCGACPIMFTTSAHSSPTRISTSSAFPRWIPPIPLPPGGSPPWTNRWW